MEVQKRGKNEQTSESESDTSAASSSTTNRPPHQQQAAFAERVDEGSRALKRGDFARAVRMYSEALELDPHNHLVYGNRALAHLKARQYEDALKDARAAKALKPKWPKVYAREAVALQCLNREAEAMGSYATGLVHDPKNKQLLQGLVTTAKQSNIKQKFSVIYTQLEKMSLADSAFVVISVIGQELLSAGAYACSLVLLECALRIGTCSLKLRGSVFSALSSSHWALGNIDKAIACMQQDLAVAKSLGDQEGECRAYGNLGAAYFSRGSYKEAITWHRQQLLLAMRHKDPVLASRVLSHLGHDYTALADYPNALASHLQSVRLTKQAGSDRLHEAREIGNVGAVYLAMDECAKALECHHEHLNIARQLNDKHEEARAYSNLGSAYHFTRDYQQAVNYHNQVLNIAKDIRDRTLEARAYAGLGHACRCMQNWSQAKFYHEQQLNNALQTKDKMAEGRSCSNLGIIYHQLGEYEAALKLHKAHLKIAKDLGDRASQGRAYGNIGNAYSALEQYEVAIRFHKQELTISKEVGDKHSECSTHGNLAVAYQALQIEDKALFHYETHLLMSKQLKDTHSELRALSNLANYHSSLKNYIDAIPLYEQYLALSQEIQDTEGEGKACHKLGYVHYCLGNYREAIRYYEQDLALAKDLQDKSSMCRAYCNLGLAHKALGDYQSSLECQKYFLATAHMTKSLSAKFCALGNIGDVLLKLNELEEAVQMFNQQLQIAKQCNERKLEATAYGNLGAAHRVLKQLDKSLAYHNQELTIYQELNETKGECKAHGHLGNVHMSLGNYTNAVRCYEEMLERGRELKDVSVEAHACGNLGIAHMNLAHFDDALGLFEQQLALLEQFNTYQTKLDRGRAFANLGDCYESLGDFEEAVKCYEQYLAIAQSTNSITDQDKAYRGLGNAHKALGNLQQALVCFEKRLYVTHEMDRAAAKCSAYGELGCLHSLLGNFEQAISCLQHQLSTAQAMGDAGAEGEAVCGLGGVYQQMGEYDRALQYHEADLNLALHTTNLACQCRAYGNLGLSHESLGEYEDAIRYQEQHLSIAVQMGDNIAKTLAYSSLGRVHHAMGNYEDATRYLKEGLGLAEQFNRKEDEAKIRHRLGLALWGHGDLEDAQAQLYKATDLFESIRREAQLNNDYKLSMFDLQTASYQVLQRVLVSLGRHEEALVVAERGRTRAFVDFLLERQKTDHQSWYQSIDSTPVTKEHILETVAKQQASVLYYSLAAGHLYTWLITPDKGLVKFEENSIGELECGSDPEDTQSVRSLRSMGNASLNGSILDGVIGHVRESLGVETQLTPVRSARGSIAMSETESEADDLWQQHVDQLHDKLNAQSDRTGFLRMLNRNHVANQSSYSLNSLLSMGSNSLSGLRAGSTRSKSSLSGVSLSSLSNRAPLTALYELLIAPMEDVLRSGDHRHRELVLVLQGDLYLVPFALLRRSQTMPALYERFHLIAVPSIRALQASITRNRQQRARREASGALAIGNPRLPQAVMDQWQWRQLPAAEHECKVISDLLSGQAVTGAAATKDTVLQQLSQPEVLHFATHVSWKLSALVLSSHTDFSTTSSVHANLERMDLTEGNGGEMSAAFNGPSLSECLLTAADILNVPLQAKLVVLSSGHSEDRAGRINSDGVVGLTRAFLAAGAQCVLFSLWPVPELASRIFLRAFYSSLLQGAKTSQAVSEAMRSVQASKKWTHASNWASWVLIGSDVKLSSKGALMGQALCQLLQTPSSAREAMRVVLHLVEKSLQRMRLNQRTSMYTTMESVQNKVGDVHGWKELLSAVGFRFEAGNNSIPAAVFFPITDPGDRLTQCSATMQALLGLAVPTLTALAKISEHFEVGEALTTLVRDANQKYVAGDANIQMPVSTRLWKAPGCHEFLASLGFDLVEVQREEVTIKAGKQANRRILHFALQALVAIFDPQDVPSTLLLDNSSSTESLATSTSAFSKGSSPPTSPASQNKSFFNPADVHKLPSANRASGKSSRSSVRSVGSNISLQLAQQESIRRKYSSEEDDPNRRGIDEDDSSISSHTGVPKTPTRPGFNYQPPKHPYSTSASDSEDAPGAESNLYLSKSLSQSRSSLASQSSTITNKSTASGGSHFRRSKFRGSAASSRSTASDRTLTNENETRSDSRSDSRGSRSGDQRHEIATKRDSSATRYNSSRNDTTRMQSSASVADNHQEQYELHNIDALDTDNTANTLSVHVHDSDLNANLTDTVSVGVAMKKQISEDNGRSHDSGFDSQLSQPSQASPPAHSHHPHPAATGENTQAKDGTQLSHNEHVNQHPAKSLPKDSPVLPPKPSIPAKPQFGGPKLDSRFDSHRDLTSSLNSNSREWYAQDDTAEESSAEVVSSSQQLLSQPPRQPPNTFNGNVAMGDKGETNSGLDPTAVAHKVMKETFPHKRSLDAMQRWSLRNMQQKRVQRQEQTESESTDAEKAIDEGTNSERANTSEHVTPEMTPHQLETSEVSSTLSDSSLERPTGPSQRSAEPTSNNGTPESQSAPSMLSMKQPPPYPGPPRRAPARPPVLANTLSDANSSFTLGGGLTAPNRSMDVQSEIIERQMSRMNDPMPLAPIPENDAAYHASSTDTDYESIQSPPQAQQPRPGALKTRSKLMMNRQMPPKMVKFKDEIDGNLESASEESLILSTKSSTEINRLQQAMRRNIQCGQYGRFSDDDSMSDSQSDLGSSMHSSGLSSSMSSREGSLKSPLGGIKGVNAQLMRNKMQELMLQNKYGGAGSGRGMGYAHHNMPQSPTGSSSGTATPPYVPQLATPPYRMPGSPLAQQPGMNALMPPSPGNQAPARPPALRHPGVPGSRYGAPLGYRTPPQGPPALPPRNLPGVANYPHTNGPLSPQNGPMGQPNGLASTPNGPYGNEAIVNGGGFGEQTTDINSSTNLQNATMNFYQSNETANQRLPDQQQSHPNQHQQPPSIPARLPITSILQNRGGANTGSPKTTAPSTSSQAPVHFQYTPNQGRFQPMNRAMTSQNRSQGMQHASSQESLQSYHSFQAFHGQQTSKEWYHSDSEASIYSSADELQQQQIERYRLADPRLQLTGYQQRHPGLQNMPHGAPGTVPVGHNLPPTSMVSHGPHGVSTVQGQQFVSPNGAQIVTSASMVRPQGTEGNPQYMTYSQQNASVTSPPGPVPAHAQIVTNTVPIHQVGQSQVVNSSGGMQPGPRPPGVNAIPRPPIANSPAMANAVHQQRPQGNYSAQQMNNANSQMAPQGTTNHAQMPPQAHMVNSGPRPQIASSVPHQAPMVATRHIAQPVNVSADGSLLHMRSDSTEDAWYKNTTDDELESQEQHAQATRALATSQFQTFTSSHVSNNAQRMAQPTLQMASTQNVPRPQIANSVHGIPPRGPPPQPPPMNPSHRVPLNHSAGYSGQPPGQPPYRMAAPNGDRHQPVTSSNRTNDNAGYQSRATFDPAPTSGEYFPPSHQSSTHNSSAHAQLNSQSSTEANPLQNENSMMSQLLAQQQQQNGGIPSKAQLLSEHQARMGFMYRDMNLKTSQC